MKIFKVSVHGKEQILHIFGAKEHFPEVPALDGKHFPASAAAIEPTELVFFPRQAFLNLLYQQPDIAINMLITLSARLRNLNNLIVELDLSKSQLAAAFPATLSRAFYRLSSDGIVAVNGTQVQLLDRDRLQNLSLGLKLIS